MKMTFSGWRREVYPHTHTVYPVKKNDYRFTPMERRKSLLWSEGMNTYGRVNELALSGDFLVEFEFTEAELRSWLMSYFETNPEAAQALVSKVQSDAIRNLSKKARKR